MPSDFRFFNYTLHDDPLLMVTPEAFNPGGGPNSTMPAGVVARLKPSTTIYQAQSGMQTIVATCREAARIGPLRRLTLIGLPEQIAGDVARMLLLVSGAALLLLFAAAANVSSLFLARTAVLKPDAAVRLALGAAPRHLLAATLAESLTLSILGGVAGMLLGAAAVKLIVLRLGAQLSISRLDEAGLNTPAFGIILLISVFLGAAAFVPSGVELMRWCKRRQIETELRAGSRALSNWGRRVRGGLVSLQICVAVILLAGTIFLSRGLISVRDQAFGPEYKGTIAMRMAMVLSSHPSPDQWKQFYDALLHYVKGVPGVRSAGLSLTSRSSMLWSRNTQSAGYWQL